MKYHVVEELLNDQVQEVRERDLEILFSFACHSSLHFNHDFSNNR